MADELKPGDHVEWDTSQGTTEGTVERKLTGETQIKGFTAKASPDAPEFLVKSDKTGAEAAHKPGELRKRGAAKTTGAKRTATKKTAAKRSTATKAAANKSAARTPAVRKPAAKKSAMQKSAAKRPPAKTSVAKRTTTKKAAAKRSR